MIGSFLDLSQSPIEAKMDLTSHASKYDSRLSSNFYCGSLGFSPVSSVRSILIDCHPVQESTSHSVASSICSYFIAVNPGRLRSALDLRMSVFFDGVCWAPWRI